MTHPTPSNPASLPSQAQPFRLDNRHALVTGGASGIGEATVKELVRAGAFVWIADIDLAGAEALASSIASAQVLHLDVTSPDSIAAAVSHLDRLDILVNNAGIGHVGSIETTEPADFDRLLNVNVRSVYLVRGGQQKRTVTSGPSSTSPPYPAWSASSSASLTAPAKARSWP